MQLGIDTKFFLIQSKKMPGIKLLTPRVQWIVSLVGLLSLQALSVIPERFKEFNNSGEAYGNLFCSYYLLQPLWLQDWNEFWNQFYWHMPHKGTLLPHLIAPLLWLVGDPWWTYIIASCALNFLLAYAIFYVLYSLSRRHTLSVLATLFILNLSFLWNATSAYASYLTFYCCSMLLLVRVIKLGAWPQKLDGLCILLAFLCFGVRPVEPALIAAVLCLFYFKEIMKSQTTWVIGALALTWWMPSLLALLHHYDYAKGLAFIEWRFFCNVFTFAIAIFFVFNLYFTRKQLSRRSQRYILLFLGLGLVHLLAYWALSLVNNYYICLPLFLLLMGAFIVILQSPWPKLAGAFILTLLLLIVADQWFQRYAPENIQKPEILAALESFQEHRTGPASDRQIQDAFALVKIVEKETKGKAVFLYDMEGFENNVMLARAQVMLFRMVQLSLNGQIEIPYVESDPMPDKDFGCEFKNEYDVGVLLERTDRPHPSSVKTQFESLKKFSYTQDQVLFSSENNETWWHPPAYNLKVIKWAKCKASSK